MYSGSEQSKLALGQRNTAGLFPLMGNFKSYSEIISI